MISAQSIIWTSWGKGLFSLTGVLFIALHVSVTHTYEFITFGSSFVVYYEAIKNLLEQRFIGLFETVNQRLFVVTIYCAYIFRRPNSGKRIYSGHGESSLKLDEYIALSSRPRSRSKKDKRIFQNRQRVLLCDIVCYKVEIFKKRNLRVLNSMLTFFFNTRMQNERKRQTDVRKSTFLSFVTFVICKVDFLQCDNRWQVD